MAKKTPFYQKHLEWGAKIVEFAGFLMPIQYKSIIHEHRKVRESVGVFDVSHMGEFEIGGPGATDFLQFLTINDVSVLEPYQAQYSAMCYNDGGIVDDLLIYKFPDRYMLVVNAANIEKDYNWIVENAPDNVEVKNISDETALLAIQGPKSIDLLLKVSRDQSLKSLPYYHFAEGMVADVECVISRTGYTGERGYELYHSPVDSEKLWDVIFEAGREFEVEPVGLGARDTLRLEMKYMLYGNDITQDTNPLEAGLGWITKLDKGRFIGKEALLKIKEAGLKRRLVCIKMKGKGVPRPHYKVFKNGEEIGEFTSGTMSPSLNVGIGLAYVKQGMHKSGTEVEVDIRGKLFQAEIVKPPFVPSRTT